MNKMVQKLIAFILSLVICASGVLNMSVSAESASTIWYGDQLAVDVTAGIDGYTFMSLFRKPASGYEFGGHFLANSSTQEGAQTFVVIDTVAHNGTTWSPNGRYEPHRSNYDVTYCCDINTMMRDGTYYKRLNLEDSEYFNDAQAAKIRSIVTNSYPYVMLEAMKENLAEGGFENADKLTRGEIIAAVQTAIWACSNNMEPLKYVKSYRVASNYQWGQPLHDISEEAGLDVTGKRVFKTYPEVGARIDALVEYLLAQTAVYADKAQIVITELKIKDEPAVLDKENNIYRVPLSLVLNNSGSGYEDNIGIRVTVGETEIVIPVVYGQKSYSIEVNAKPGDEIKAVVSGTQVLPEGVYFYAPKAADIDGDGVATSREVSQNMVGVAMGRTEVYAEDSVAFEELEIHVPVHTRGSVIVTKNTSGATTPADATFQLQKMEGDEWINVGEPVAYSAFVENAYTFTELEEGTYRVVESGAEIEEFRLETTYGENVVLTKTTAENGDTSVSSGSALVTNIYTPYIHTPGSITVNKIATGAATPAGATFQLQKMEGNEWINVGEPVAYSAFVENAYTFTELEEGTYRVIESGAEIEEFHLETTYGENVVLTKTTANNGDTSVSSGSALVTNIYTPYIHTPGSIVVNKTTTGAATPAGATFQLQKLNGESWTNVGEAVAYSAFVDNAYTFTDLVEGTYRVVESGAEIEEFRLETTYSENVVLTKTTADNGDTSVNSGSILVTNVYDPFVHTLGSIVVNKTTSGATTPADATFQLQILNGETWTNVGEAVPFSAFVDNAYTFAELEEGTYRIVESGAEVEGYTLETTYSANVVLTKTTADNGDTAVDSNKISVTNAYAIEEKPTEPEETEPEDNIEIPDEDVPLASTPVEEEEEEEDDLIEIPDEDVPMADVPKTGDLILPFIGVAIASGAATIFVGKAAKKKEEE